MDEATFVKLTDAYKEQVYTRLEALLPERLARLERAVFEDKTTEEVLALVYMQGVAEALDVLDPAELFAAPTTTSQNTGLQL